MALAGSNLYVVWTETNSASTPTTQDIFFAKSNDHSATFSSAVNLSNDGVSQSARLAVSGTSDNTVYVAWSDGPNISFKKSIDGGSTFGSVIPLGIQNSPFGLAPQIAASGNNVYVVWDQINLITSTKDVFYTFSTDGGTTWNTPVNLSNNGLDNPGLDQVLALGNNVVVVWAQGTSPAEVFEAKTSTDGGVTFGNSQVISGTLFGAKTAIHSKIALGTSGPNNNVYVLWDEYSLDFTKFDVYFTRSTDGGATWSSSPTHLSNNGMSTRSQMDPPLSGDVFVVWNTFDFATNHADVFFTRSMDGGATWSSPMDMSNDGHSGQALIAADGMEVVTPWLNFHCNDASCSTSTDNIRGRQSMDGGTTFIPAEDVTTDGMSVAKDDKIGLMPPGQLSMNYTVVEHQVSTTNTNHEVLMGVTFFTTSSSSPPTANDVPVNTDENKPSAPITLNGMDSDSDPITFKCDLPTHGTLAGCNGGTYTPNKDFAGRDDFTFHAIDAIEGLEVMKHVVIDVHDTSKPVAVGQTIPLTEPFPSSFTITLSGSDPDATTDGLGVGTNQLSFALASPASHGTAVVSSSGAATYTPAAGFEGDDSFTFTTSEPDGIGGSVKSDPVTVFITTTNPSKPTAASILSIPTDENTPLAIPLTGTDPDGDALTFECTPPTVGTVKGCTGGIATYTPKTDFAGPDSFTFRAIETDASGGIVKSDPATVNIKVNDKSKPTANGGAVSTTENNPTNPFALTGSDSDAAVDGNPPLTFTLVPSSGPSNGKLAGCPAACVYKPKTDFAGPDTFTFTVSELDGNGGTVTSDPATVAITVKDTSTPTANNNRVDTTENNPTNPFALTGSDSDAAVDGNPPLTFTLVPSSGPSNGKLAGCPAACVYKPSTNFAGIDKFLFTASEPDGNGGTVDSLAGIIEIGVQDTSVPIAVDQTVSTFENTPSAPIKVNAIDPDGDVLLFSAKPATPPSVGFITANGGNLSPVDPKTGTVIYTPKKDFAGTDSIVYTVSESDGIGGVVESSPTTITFIVTAGPTPSTTLTKTTSISTIFGPTSVTYTYVETNTGSTSLRDIAITDPNCSPLVLTSAIPPTATTANLPPSGSLTFKCTKTESTTITDTATATGNICTDATCSTPGSAAPKETASATVTLTPPLPSTFTVPSATGAGPVTFSTDAGGFSSLTAVSESSLSPPPPSGSYPFGFFSWSITGFAPASKITVIVTFPSAVPPGTQYLKLVGGTWVSVPISISANTITMTIQDNGPFDADPTVGTISDPGGLLVPTIVPPPTTSPVGGIILPADMTALFVAGALTNAFWILPTLGGIAGAAITLFKVKRKLG